MQHCSYARLQNGNGCARAVQWDGAEDQERNRCISEMSSKTAIPAFVRNASAGGSKKSRSFVQRISASPMTAVCMTTVAQDLGQLVEHLVREQQNMIGLDGTDQEIAGKPFRTAMSSNEDGGVEDDSHGWGR